MTNYPFTIDQTVVVNEVLANSGADPDWIELHNRTSEPINIGGWFLSDSSTDLAKYESLSAPSSREMVISFSTRTPTSAREAQILIA
ncbi:lamin tail domain-containing protein [Akkermansiaceae bacterium]|nr:lamin tail domain-containing protein [Akkermansiaceae bacterium]